MEATNARSLDEYGSPEEVAIALAALGEADFARLGRIAQLRARGLPGVEWRDILHDAIQRSLDGTRRWPVDVPFVAFLRGVMRSIASEHWRRRMLDRRDAQPANDEGFPDQIETIASDEPDPERSAIARDLVEHLERLVADDPVLSGIVAGIGEGLDPTDIQARVGLSATEYNSARRRLRRLITRATPEMLG
ncbi:sigma-70 family RNA polymerase sigma factor [Mesorhizobium helmanticense]|uniref:sigma-70 family RNA polymerase sigma factor n=1 Tax=Mesorhizobium helmanticense TaxID=1776423 RepID=UPI0011B23618|nr:sigma-70 family RNA polymerase sigma factor [Mesorhizobium helmanticense]